MRANAVANRERILVAAEAVFGEHGATGSTEEVASRAGVGIGTVFRHFPTKAELIEAALVRHLDQLATRAESRAAADDAGAGLFAVITEMIHAGATKLTLASLLSGGTFTAPVHEAGTRVRARVDALLRRAIDDGSVRDDVTVDEVYLLIHALAQSSAVSTPHPGTLEAAIRIVIDGLRA